MKNQHASSHKRNGLWGSTLVKTWFALLFLIGASAMVTATETKTFAPGAYIIDMGVANQTAATGLKPYGLVYQLVTAQQVPVQWAINPANVTDKNQTTTIEGIDFTANGKNYRGGSFIIPAEYVTPSVQALITTWRGYGVVVDGPLPVGFTAPIYDTITSFPNAVLDEQNGSKLIASFYGPSGVPATSYKIGGPEDLTTCDDVYGMPHADPQQWDADTRAKFDTFIKAGGSLWASCHSVSALEAPAPTYCGFNYLSTTGLVPWGSHVNANTPPFAYNSTASIWTDPLMQFLGKVDLSLQGGSEEIYVPKTTWASHAKVAVFDQFHSGTSHTDPYAAAAEVIFGKAYGNPSYGTILYVASHAFQADGTAQNTAVGRLYGNLLLQAGLQRKLNITTTVPAQVNSGETVTVSASVTGGSASGYTYKWTSSCGGTFADPTAASTTFTAPSVETDAPCVVRVAISDSCACSAFGANSVTTKAPPPPPGPTLGKTADWIGEPAATTPGNNITYTLNLGTYDGPPLVDALVEDFIPARTTYVTGSGTEVVSDPDPLVWQLGSNEPDRPGQVTATGISMCPETVSVIADADTYIKADKPNEFNHGNETTLKTRPAGNAKKHGLVHFTLPTLPTGAIFTGAKLTLRSTTSRNNHVIELHRMLTPWTESAGWGDADGAGTGDWAGGVFSSADYAPTAYGSVLPRNSTVTADVTTLVQDWMVNGNNGLVMLATGTDTGDASWNTSENTAGQPTLQITYLNPSSTGCVTVLPPVADTYVDEKAPSILTAGADNEMWTTTKSTEVTHSLVRFDMSMIPSGSIINSADLRLYVTAARSSHPDTLYRMTTPWLETANWNDPNGATIVGDWFAGTFGAGDYNSTSLGIITNGTGGAKTNSISSTVNSWVNEGVQNDGLVILAGGTDDGDVKYGTKENTDPNKRPQLSIKWETPKGNVGTTTRLITSPWKLIAGGNMLTVTMQVTVGPVNGGAVVTPPATLSPIGTGGAFASQQTGPTPASASVPSGGGTVSFTYTFQVQAGTQTGSIAFQGRPSSVTTDVHFALAISDTVLVEPPLEFQVKIDSTATLINQIPN